MSRSQRPEGPFILWKVVYIAPSQAVAESLRGLLQDSGLLAMLRPVGIVHQGEARNVEILVPESEAEEAHEVLAAAFGNA